MATNTVGSTHVNGTLTCQAFTAPPLSIGDTAIAAGTNVDADKLQHRFRCTFNQIHGSVATTERRPIYEAYATATLLRVRAGSVVACSGAATITVDVKKNNTSMLTAVITLDSGNTAYILEAATLASTALVAGDVLEVVVVATAGGGTLGQGLIVVVDIDENGV